MCMCACVCLRVFTHACASVCTHVCTYTHTHRGCLKKLEEGIEALGLELQVVVDHLTWLLGTKLFWSSARRVCILTH